MSQGFTNQQTDELALYLEDNAMDLGFWENEAAELYVNFNKDVQKAVNELASQMKTNFEVRANTLECNSFFKELLLMSLNKVDWNQIAETLVEQIKSNVD